jgi:Fur family ferric uptake transcriptional regulator
MSETNQDKAREKFSAFLQKSGLKPTAERLTIFSEAMATVGHFEADDLLVILKQRGRKTSRATIYRTLEILAQAGILRKLCFEGAAIQFEKAADTPHHDHLICRKCGARFEFYHSEMENLQADLAKEYNFRITDYTLQVYGLCANCAGE